MLKANQVKIEYSEHPLKKKKEREHSQWAYIVTIKDIQ